MKVAIYCRLSEEDRNKQNQNDDSESIQNQKSILIDYAYQQGWDVYNIYSDDDYTGADRNRPEFLKLIDDAKQKKFDIVLCKTQSRFTRELELVEKYLHDLFPALGIRFISIVDHADTDIKGNKKARQINGLQNEWYLEDLSDNIKSVFNNKMRKGEHIGSFALYGYKKDPNQKGHLIIDEEVAPIVREVFQLFSQGYGKTAICRILNEKGIPNPTEYKRQKGLRYKNPTNENSKLWKYFAIAYMLINEMYIGNMVQGRYGSISYKSQKSKPKPKDQWYIVENTHDPIIDKELWDRVQLLVKEKAKPFITGKVGLFAKKTKCMYCGYTLRSKKNHGFHYLGCTTKHIDKNACIGSFISYIALEREIIKQIHILSKEFLDEGSLEKNIIIDQTHERRKKALEEEISLYQKKVDEYVKALRDTYLDKSKGILSDNDFIQLSNEFSNDKNKIEKLIIEKGKELDEVKKRIQSSDNRREIIEQYTNLENLNREIVEKLIDYVVIGKRDPVTRNVPIEIYWNF